jgi:hypothetical protein
MTLALAATSWAEPLGSVTLMPERAFWSVITDDVTMNIISRTRKISVRGVILISAKISGA